MDGIDVGAVLDATRGGSGYSIAQTQFHAAVLQSALEPDNTAGYVREVARTKADPLALVDGWSIRGDWSFGWGHSIVADLDGTLALVEYSQHERQMELAVYSPQGVKFAQEALDGFLALCPPLPPPEDAKSVDVTFWTNTAMGPRSYVRTLEAPSWNDVKGNYPADIRGELEQLSEWELPAAGGKLILAHGPAGTGKTTIARSLAQSWKGWCDFHAIVDADQFFGDASYMVSVLLGSDYGSQKGKWRLLVVEDCDELLTVDAKERSGQQVARLLNVCDGMVGQGLKILLFLSTNEKVDRFHEAIVRPGRCLKNIYFGALKGDEADEWRQANGIPKTGEDASLAELYGEHRTLVEHNVLVGKRR